MQAGLNIEKVSENERIMITSLFKSNGRTIFVRRNMNFIIQSCINQGYGLKSK